MGWRAVRSLGTPRSAIVRAIDPCRLLGADRRPVNTRVNGVTGGSVAGAVGVNSRRASREARRLRVQNAVGIAAAGRRSSLRFHPPAAPRRRIDRRRSRRTDAGRDVSSATAGPARPSHRLSPCGIWRQARYAERAGSQRRAVPPRRRRPASDGGRGGRSAHPLSGHRRRRHEIVGNSGVAVAPGADAWPHRSPRVRTARLPPRPFERPAARFISRDS